MTQIETSDETSPSTVAVDKKMAKERDLPAAPDQILCARLMLQRRRYVCHRFAYWDM